MIANCSAAAESSSAPRSLLAQPAAPEFFFLTHSGKGTDPVVAFNAVTGALVGPNGVLPGVAVTPAKPGDYVALYTTGLGLTDPVFAPGVLPNEAAPTVSPITVSLNGQPLAEADILYEGVAPGFAGVYQINIRIPADMPTGNLPLSVSIDGVSTQGGGFLAVGQ